MGIHHIALTTKDVKANHEFYTGAMGFRLIKVEVARAGEQGFAKHLFYDTGGGGMIAFWDMHDPELGDDWSPAIASGLGLPGWTNHLAFDAENDADLQRRLERWLEHGHNCWEIDHGWCKSIYVMDPNDIMVEFCVTTRELTSKDAGEALALLQQESPDLTTAPPVKVHKAKR